VPAYLAFGRRFETELTLPWPPAARLADALPPVRVSRVDLADAVALPFALGAVRYGKVNGSLVVDVPWAARFEIADQSSIRYTLAADADGRAAAEYFSGLVAGFWLRTVAEAVLHGSAVEGPGGAWIIVGASGSGKSSGAAELARRGHALMCDDSVPLAAGPTVLPGVAMSRLGADGQDGAAGSDGADKVAVPPSAARHEPCRLAGIVRLAAVDADRPELRPARGAARLALVAPFLQLLEGVDDRIMTLAKLAGMLPSVPVYALDRPLADDTRAECADLVERLMEAPDLEEER